MRIDRIPLRVLMNRHGTDKLHVHHYDEEYERHFAPLRDRPIRLLEIGVGGYSVPGRGGESLKVWRDYFPNALIYGLDVEDKSFLDAGRLHTIRGSQSDPETLERIDLEHGPFDVVIDDGSHVQSDILVSFNALFPRLAPGGIYVIEDLATAYDPGYGGTHCDMLRNDDRSNAIHFLASLIDGLHWPCWKGRGPSDVQRLAKSVHVSRELAFIYRH